MARNKPPSAEGELKFGIGHDDNGNVHIDFLKEIQWLALTPQGAREFASAILLHANRGMPLNG